jgi:uncharacterized phage protein gp47/JayE
MSSFGVTPEGFSQKELEDIQTEIESDLRAAFGPQINLLPDSVFGQIVGTFSDKLAELWEVEAAIYRSQYPDSASDEALDQVASITGVVRDPAVESQVTLDQLNLDGSVTLPAGRIVSVGANGNRFVTQADVTNPNAYPGTFSVVAKSEQTGPVTGFAKTIDTIVTPVAGWTAQAAVNSGNPETYNFTGGGQTLLVKVDGGAAQTVTFLIGDFTIPAAATAAEVAARITTDLTGATALDAGGSVRIESDLDGSGSSLEVTGGTAQAELDFPTDEVKGLNSLDALLGADEETDADLRIRREQSLAASGAATIDAIRAAVLAVESVSEAFVFENVTEVTDPAGVDPHAFEVVIRGPTADDQEVAEAIFDVKAAGIKADGTISKTVTDDQGFDHTISFSRATEIEIYEEITITVNTDPDEGPIYPADGDDQVKAALVASGNALGIGRDVIYEKEKCQAFSVSGVLDITDFQLDTSGPPSGTSNIPIAVREIAVFDTSRVTVNS